MRLARTKAITAIACTVGAATGALTYMTSHSLPQALLAAGGATGGSADLILQFIHTEHEPPASDPDDKQDEGRDDIEHEKM